MGDPEKKRSGPGANRTAPKITTNSEEQNIPVDIAAQDVGAARPASWRDARQVDSELDQVLDRGAALLSRDLEHVDRLADIANRYLDDGSPTSVIGAIVASALTIERGPT